MKSYTFSLISGLGVLLTLIATSCDIKQKTTPTEGSMTIYCDNSFEDVLEELISVYEYRYPKTHILSRYTTQIEAVDSLLADNTRSIIIARDLTTQEKNQLKNKGRNVRSRMLAVDAVALIVNNENPVDYLSYKEIGEILTGNISKWNEIDPGWSEKMPKYPELPVTVYFDSPGSSLALYMRDSLTNNRPFGKNVLDAGSVKEVFEKVKSRKGSIGVVGVSVLTRDLGENNMTTEERVAALSNDTSAVDGMAINKRMDEAGVKTLGVIRYEPMPRRPYQQYIYDGRYPLTRQIYMITTASPGGLAGAFYTFCLGVDGQRIIMRTGVLPARVNRNIVELVQE